MNNNRLLSLDAFRGFDMLWIMGGEELVAAIAILLGFPKFDAECFNHVVWEGVNFMDTIFPTFLFLAGVSFPFSAAKSAEKGLSRGQIAWRAVRRGLILVALGLVYDGFLMELNFANFRIPSVLGFIGIGWMVAALIYLYVRNVFARVAIALGLLAVTTLVFGFIEAPDAAAVFAAHPEFAMTGTFSPSGNLGCYFDRLMMGAHLLNPNFFDNEGTAGLMPGVVTAMLGMFAGDIVRRGGNAATGKKALALLACAIVSALAGWLLSGFYPIVKKLWSPSFALVVGGYSFAMFALFYWIIDVKGFRRWPYFFVVIGVNSITIYLAQAIVRFDNANKFIFGGLAKLMPTAQWGDVLLSVSYILVCWIFLCFLHRKNIHLKV